MPYGITRFLKMIRKFLFSTMNKQLFIFIFFLILSGIFWMIMTLNETYEREIPVVVQLTGLPKNVIVLGDNQDTLRITIKDKGHFLLAYLYGDVLRPISVDFKSHDKGGKCVVSASEVQKLLHPMLYTSSKITGYKPSQLEFFYNYGQKRMVPVQLNGEVHPQQSYSIMKILFEPDKVQVYANDTKLDSLEHVLTTHIALTDVKDTTVMEVELQKMAGVKCVPSKVKMSIFPDVLTEESMEIPVTAINVPEGKVLRIFPARVKVNFTIAASEFRKIHPVQFTVVADYGSVIDNPSDKCPLVLQDTPPEVKNAHLEITEVNYLVESQ